jgi:hypothetical protein
MANAPRRRKRVVALILAIGLENLAEPLKVGKGKKQ